MPENTTEDKSLKNNKVASVDANGKITAEDAGTTDIIATTSNGKTVTCKVTVIKQIPSVAYQTHIQDIGWQGWKSNGTMSGTSGQSKRLEAIQINLTGEMADK